MKRFFISLLLIFLFIPLIGSLNINIVFASDLKSCGYEVAYINDDGTFKNDSCYNDFASAKKRMKELGGDYVIRHDASYSYTKIIAMNSGIAYSYPRNDAILNIYQDVNNINKIEYKKTYVARHFELNYVDTERYLKTGDGRGMIEVNLNGFHGYTDLEYVDLIPSKYIEMGIPIKIGGNNTYTHEDYFTIIPKQNYYECIESGNYSEIVYHIFRGYPEKGYEPVSETLIIGPSPEMMQKDIKYYSYDGINFYMDSTYENYAFTYYNYYQFLPLRSKTNISSEYFDNYISNYKDSIMLNTGSVFIDAQNKYGINALLLFSMAVHESGNGTSSYAKSRNNLFGWNAVDADPNKASYFASVADCIYQQAGINLRGFIDITDGRFFSSSLGNKGSGLNVKYASDPYWGMEIASIAYTIDKQSRNKDGTLTDYDYYCLSLIKDFDVPIKDAPLDSAKTLYTTQYGPYYQENFIVIDLGSNENYTKIQSTNPIDKDGNLLTHRTPITIGDLNPISYGEYDFNQSVAYIESKHLEVINKKNSTIIEDQNDEKVLMRKIDNIIIENNMIHIDGCAFIKGMDAKDLNLISGTIDIINNLDKTIYKSYPITISKYDDISFGDSYLYEYAGFSIDIPLDDIKEGSYSLLISINNNGTVLSKYLNSTKAEFANINKKYQNLNYRIRINSLYNYRMELECESLPLVVNYKEINKPINSIRNSMFSFNSIQISEKGTFKIDGQALIYYTDYSDINTLSTTLYLVDDASNYVEIKCENYKTDFDYQQAFNYSFNLDYISFKASEDINSISKGNYMMILKISNGDYVDYIDLSTTKSINNSIEINEKSYRIYKSNLKNRLMLEIK